MAPDNFITLEIDKDSEKRLKAMFGNVAKFMEHPKMIEAMLASAFILEGESKKQLDEMVYSQPEGDYKRTRKLFNATVVQGQKVSIVGDHVNVSGQPEVKKTKNNLTTGVESHVNYSVYVHSGTGMDAGTGPRPYFTKGAQKVKGQIEKEISKRIGETIQLKVNITGGI